MASGGSTRQEVGSRPIVLRAFGYVSAAGLALYAVLLSRQRQVDFEVYRMGGQHVLGSDLYFSHVTVAAGNLLFTYTPLAAMLFWPFSLVSTGVGRVVWDITNVVALTALVAVSSAAARRRPLVRSDWYLALIALAPAGLLLWPVRYDLKLGQIDLVLVLMIVTDLNIGLSWRGKRLPPGVLVGVVAAIKLTPLIFLPYLLVTRKWRAAKNTAAAFMLATGVMMALAPRSSWNYFTRYVYAVHRVGDSSITNNQTFRAALVRAGLAQSHVVVDLLLVIVFCAGLALAALAFRRSSDLLGVLLCAATGLLVSPISWQHHYVWCVPLVVWLIFGVDRPRRATMWALIAAIIMMVMPPGQYNDLSVMWYVRENAYVLATVGFMALVAAMLWTRSRASTTEAEDVLSRRSRGCKVAGAAPVTQHPQTA